MREKGSMVYVDTFPMFVLESKPKQASAVPLLILWAGLANSALGTRAAKTGKFTQAYFCNTRDVIELAAHEPIIRKDKRPVRVKPDRDDILCILPSKMLIVLNCAVALANEVLLVCPRSSS